MLVLSRRQNETIVFPKLGIRIVVARIAGKVVRLGVDAPNDVRVFREEAVASPHAQPHRETPMSRQERHAYRNRLNAAMLGLQLLQRRLEAGQTDDVDALIGTIVNRLHEANAQLDKVADTVPKTEPQSHHHHALIVEDNLNEAKLLAEYLRLSGYEVDVVGDGLQALSYLRKHEHPDFVLLDMNMPEMDGPETISTIRSEPGLRDLTLFGVSGADRLELAVDCGPEGVDRWFSKPVDARRLVDEMNRELAAV